jgi:uncharacterized protein with PQ loop repeat
MNGQFLSWIFSIISNILWLFVFIPQFYTNYKNKNADGISLLLLFFMFFGDIFLLISSIAKNLNYVIIYTCVYHVCLDLIIISQSIYYRIDKSPNDNDNDNEEFQETIQLLNENYFNYTCFYFTFYETVFFIVGTILSLSISLLLFIHNSSYISNSIAWISTLIFTSARIPQIILNYKRKSTKGLSFLSFVIINIANIFFLLSILILLLDLDPTNYLNYIISIIYFIVGNITSSCFDLIIFYQFYKYTNNNIDFITINSNY